MPMPRGDNVRLQLRQHRRVNQRGPTDLRGGRSAMARGNVAVLRVNDDEANRPFLLRCPLERDIERVRPVKSVHA